MSSPMGRCRSDGPPPTPRPHAAAHGATTVAGLLPHAPAYHHHRLIRDDQGKRLAKRDDARALSKYRDEGATPADIRRMVGL